MLTGIRVQFSPAKPVDYCGFKKWVFSARERLTVDIGCVVQYYERGYLSDASKCKM